MKSYRYYCSNCKREWSVSQAVGAEPWDESKGCRYCESFMIELVEYQSNFPGGDIRREDIRMPELPIPDFPMGVTEVIQAQNVISQVSPALLESVYDLSDMD